MSRGALPLRTTFADYLAIDEASDEKHQLVNGEVFAMTGGTFEHAILIAQVARLLGNALTGGPCRVAASELRVRVLASGLATYPDVPIVCGPPERDPEHRHTITNPTVLVEVLSDSTEAFDRGEKFRHYRQIPSLKAYLLVSQHEPSIELYERSADGSWRLTEAGVGGHLTIGPLGCALSVDAVYEGVFPRPEATPETAPAAPTEEATEPR